MQRKMNDPLIFARHTAFDVFAELLPSRPSEISLKEFKWVLAK